VREEAVPRFREALALDSTFALAALELLRAAAWIGTTDDSELGERLARAGRDRLGLADRFLLDALVGEVPGVPELLLAWNAAVAAYPNRPDTWYGLGETYFHWGRAAGIPDALTRAEAAFRQGWRLDSAASAAQGLGGALVAEPAEHMVQLAHLRHDTSEVRRLAALVLAADSTGYLAPTVEWHRAALGTPASRDAFWARIGQVPMRTLMLVSLFIGFTGEGLDDYARMYEEDRRRLTTHDPGFAEFALTVYAMLRGRPGEVPRGPAPPEALASSPRRFWLRRALWWEGDTTGMGAVVRALEASVAREAVTPTEVRDRYLDLCALGLWHATRGDHAPARGAGAALVGVRLAGLGERDSARSGNHLALCAALIEASAATGLAARDARAKLEAADSLARHVAFVLAETPSLPEANLLLARLWETQGDLPRALEAVRRRVIYIGAPVLITTFLREEGRLAALTGDTAGAVRAYRHYLGLRYDPEPVLRPEVERVRHELAALEKR
jgi:serine/threonine-protein kinase